MHEANFELIEIPHVRQSGKNSADIRMVVDALDLCYTKGHVNTFVIISGDSDFSPLVSKLRENAKRVIGVGVKQSTSDLLIANCDEFIYYDDLVREREARRGGGRRDQREAQARRSPEEEKARREEMEARRGKGLDMAAETLEALLEDRADDERVWASVLKEALKRRHPGFNENYHGFKTFGALLEEAQKRGLLEFGRDEKSGAYVKRRLGAAAPAPLEGATPLEAAAVAPPTEVPAMPQVAEAPAAGAEATAETAAVTDAAPPAPRRRSRAKKATATPASAAPARDGAVEVAAATKPKVAAKKAAKSKKPAAPRKPRAAAKKKAASE
jgi:hypothetical protein